ncbi:MAG: cupin domain-containing protein [Pseudomonadota bacterium]
MAPGEQGFPLHLHHGEEEWAYVLSGEGEVQLDDHTKAILPGTYILFPAAREAHAIRNTGTEDLVCLMGGTAPAADVIDLPEHGHRVAKTRNGFEAAPLDSFTLKNPVTTPEG